MTGAVVSTIRRGACPGLTALALAIAGCGGQDSSQNVAANLPPPALLLNLSHWELNLPVDSAGNQSGNSATIPAAQLVAGYRSQWFDTASDLGVIFAVPATGATTAAADSPRTELREQIAPPTDTTNWSASGNSRLDATLAVLKVPDSSGKLVIGQIHGYNSDPMLKLIAIADGSGHYSVVGEYQISPNGTPSYTQYTLATSIAAGQRFSYHVVVNNSVIDMSVDGGSSATQRIGLGWLGTQFYFKAGAYTYSSGLAGDDAAAEFYALSATHS